MVAGPTDDVSVADPAHAAVAAGFLARTNAHSGERRGEQFRGMVRKWDPKEPDGKGVLSDLRQRMEAAPMRRKTVMRPTFGGDPTRWRMTEGDWFGGEDFVFFVGSAWLVPTSCGRGERRSRPVEGSAGPPVLVEGVSSKNVVSVWFERLLHTLCASLAVLRLSSPVSSRWWRVVVSVGAPVSVFFSRP